MNLIELKEAIDYTVESVREGNYENPEDVQVSMQIDGPGRRSIYSTEIKLHYDEDVCASGFVILGEYNGGSGEKNFDASRSEPMSLPGKTDVLPAVIADFKCRDTVGRQKYGTTLRTHNGRDSLIDAYQEACDLVMYLRQTIMERNGK